MKPKVSVVVAIYNVAEYIEQCMRSLFEQTLDSVEYVFVDDCSPDDSMEIVSRVLKEYPQRQGQVNIIRHEQNMGVAVTKNDGIRSATGEYFIVVDPDDYVEQDMLEVMYEKAEKESADMVLCDFYRFAESWCEVDTMVYDGVRGDGENVRDDIINRKVPSYCLNKLIRKSLFEGDDVVWPVGRFAEDIVYSVVSALKAKRISYVAQPLYHYRSREGALTHAHDEEKCLRNCEGYRLNVDIMVNYLRKNGVEDKYWKGILIQKLRTRNRLLPLTNRRKYIKQWFHTYPELNKVLFWGDSRYHSTYREKIWFIAVGLGLYPRYKNKLGGRHLRPFPEWPVW